MNESSNRRSLSSYRHSIDTDSSKVPHILYFSIIRFYYRLHSHIPQERKTFYILHEQVIQVFLVNGHVLGHKGF
jgi:hypothetical protein